VLDRENGTNEWNVTPGTVFHSSNDSGLFQPNPTDTSVVLYEGKMFEQYNHRYGSYEGLRSGERVHILPETPVDQLKDPDYRVRPCWFVENVEVEEVLSDKWDCDWLLAFRNITSAGLWRTTIYSILPRCGCSDKAPLVFFSSENRDLAPSYLGCMNSFVLDFVSRQKIGGASYSFFIKRQLAIVPPSRLREAASWSAGESVDRWLRPRVLELMYTAWDLQPFGQDFGSCGPPFRWDPERRFSLRCEVDAAFFHLYLSPDENGDWCASDNETKEDLSA
jgi:hypothetical protein